MSDLRTKGQIFTHQALPAANAVLEMTVEPENQVATCSILTPLIKARLKELGTGQVLEVRVNDPTAREDITSWCRLSGNELLAMADEGHQGLRFFLKKK
jgi:TusA-related sulfurtransferase